MAVPHETGSREPPLAATLKRGRMRIHRGCHLGAEVHAAAREGAVTLDTLVEDEPGLADLLARIGQDVGSSRADVQASLLVEAYAWALLLPLVGALVVERRVPLLEPDEVAVVLRDGMWPDALVLSGSRFASLAEDPDARHDDAVVVDGEEALAATLRDQVIGHLRSSMSVLSARTRRPQRALWRSVADRLAAATLFAGEAIGDVERGARIARSVLGGPLPLSGGPDYRIVTAPEGPMRLHARKGCCLWWRTEAARYCLSCPCARDPAAAPNISGG